ncbi:MAG: glycosyltransferase family 39 protein [Anaerolineae bacterium]|nr:glycosyltransferase family 39 protein [Anaerolineae bacterium]
MNNTINKIKNNLDLCFLVLLAGFLNIYNLWRLGYGNGYYAAAIKSMTQSLSNFFFVSFDSVGFISVDKAPLSLWLDTIFAKIFGFSGFIILLPHALAGIAVTILTYIIVNKVAGKLPAFVAGLVITLSPVNVAVYRNNTPDALLLVFVLLAILFAVDYFKQKKMLFLLLSAAMIGLGFNTKMMQAFLVLPALVGAMVIFAEGKLFNKFKIGLIYLLVTAFISFSWITIVDLTPADMRPYMGGSDNDSAWNLALGYNGAQRLLGEDGVGGRNGFNVGGKGPQRLFVGEMATQTGWLLVSAILFSGYYAVRNFKKLFRKMIGQDVPVSRLDFLNTLNIGFFITGYLFFSFASFFHSYYLNIFAVPIAFLMGGLAYEIRDKGASNRLLPLILLASVPVQVYLILQAGYAVWLAPIIVVLAVVALVAIFYQPNKKLVLAGGVAALVSLMATPLVWSGYTTLYGNTASPIFIGGPQVRGPGPGGPGGRGGPPGGPGGFAWGGNPGGPPPRDGGQPPAAPGFAQGTNGSVQPPAADGLAQGNNRSGQPPTNSDPNMPAGIPPAGGGAPPPGGGMFGPQNIDAQVLTYLKQNYDGEKYFVAVSSQNQATRFILNEDIGNVMTLGGFSGRDQTLTLAQFKEKVASGELRFFLLDNGRGGPGGMPGGGPGNGFAPTGASGAPGAPPAAGAVPGVSPAAGGNPDLAQAQSGRNGLSADPNGAGRSNRGGGGMFNANQDITNWVRENAVPVDGMTGLYDLRPTEFGS